MKTSTCSDPKIYPVIPFVARAGRPYQCRNRRSSPRYGSRMRDAIARIILVPVEDHASERPQILRKSPILSLRPHGPSHSVSGTPHVASARPPECRTSRSVLPAHSEGPSPDNGDTKTIARLPPTLCHAGSRSTPPCHPRVDELLDARPESVCRCRLVGVRVEYGPRAIARSPERTTTM